MNVIKRNGSEVQFDKQKIYDAVTRANTNENLQVKLTSLQIQDISDYIDYKCNKLNRAISVEDIQDMVEEQIMAKGNYELAKKYVIYRYKRSLARKTNKIDDAILSIINQDNEEVKQENSNKNPVVNSVQRDYIAGEISRDITNRFLLDKDIVDAHNAGIIHFHDSDYYIQKMFNCCLINLEDMLQNGTVISETFIEKPHSFATACNITTQIIAQVASNQYGGQSITLSHLAPFVDISRQKYKKLVEEEFVSIGKEYTEDDVNKIAEMRLEKEISQGIQMIQYQVITLMTTNGQAPFITVFMYIDEVPEGQIREDLALIIKEMLKLRIKGVQNEEGVYITPAFPKLIYVLEEDNVTEDSKYWDITKLSAKCTAKRMVPDYISEKVMKKLKIDENGEGQCYPVMGAARGDETVSIKIYNDIFNDIRIDDAIHMIRLCTKKQFIEKTFSDPSEPSLYNVSGIYRITHNNSGKFYIGSSKNIGRRFCEHRYSIRHKKTLGDNYFIGDPIIENYTFEILETCSPDNIFEIESQWYNDLYDENYCVNFKDPINNGNFNSETHLIALNGETYSSYENKSFNWFKRIEDPNICVKSRGQWQPIRSLIINKENCPLKLYYISYDCNGEIKTLHITEDHPLHTTRGRIMARDLNIGDFIIKCNNNYVSPFEKIYPITSITISDEHVCTYDFETDNDMFDLSEILSHNCRSALTTYLDENGKPKYYGRFNQGVVTINLPDIALSSYKDFDKFWTIFDERLELCYKALMLRHKRLLGTFSDASPIHWQNGAIARLKKGETIDKLLFNGYSTLSLGYAGLYECVKYMTGKSHTDPEATPFALDVMKHLNDACAKWKEETTIAFSLYGTPIESTTYKFAKCLQKRFGIIEGITDKNYITNSYHVHVTEPIDAFSKIKFESQFLALSPGGAVSYVEVPNMQDNIPAVLSVMRYIYDNILYAELNTKSDYCQVCGYNGEIVIEEDENKKLIWKCPKCGNTDQNKMNVARRTCGLTILYSPH